VSPSVSYIVPRWVYEPQRVVHAVGVSVEALGARRVLHVPVGREEGGRGGVVHAPVHVDEAEQREILVTGEAAVEHGLSKATGSGVVHPGARIAGIAPCVVAQALLHVAVAVGDDAPAAEVVLEDIVYALRLSVGLDHGEHAARPGDEGQRAGEGSRRAALGDELAPSHVVLRAAPSRGELLHPHALPVEAVGIAEAVAALPGRPRQVDPRQPVHVVVCERLLHPGGVVFSGGLVTEFVVTVFPSHVVVVLWLIQERVSWSGVGGQRFQNTMAAGKS